MTMRSAADNMWMMYPPADDMWMMYLPADDVWMTYVIRQPKSPTKSHSRVICMSFMHRPHVVRASSARRMHETSVPRLFQVKQQRTALLKIQADTCTKITTCKYHEYDILLLF